MCDLETSNGQEADLSSHEGRFEGWLAQQGP